MIIASLGTGRYLGGLPGRSQEVRGRVWATDDGIGVGPAFPSEMLVPLAEIAAVTVETVAVAKSKVPAAIAFGVVGALAARGSENKVAVTVKLVTGDTAYFRLDVLELPFVQSMISPWMREHGLEQASNPPGGGEELMGQLERLAALKASGALTEHEFAAAKAKLLSL
jgi:hypothetical protein